MSDAVADPPTPIEAILTIGGGDILQILRSTFDGGICIGYRTASKVFCQSDTWMEIESLVGKCNFIAMDRPMDDLRQLVGATLVWNGSRPTSTGGTFYPLAELYRRACD